MTITDSYNSISKPRRFWIHRHNWKGFSVGRGIDEYTRKTVYVNFAGLQYVLAYRYDTSEESDVIRGEPNGYRVVASDGGQDLVDYLISVHKYSRNRLPLTSYLGWDYSEVANYLKFGIIPVE